jgi:hypothetical protein
MLLAFALIASSLTIGCRQSRSYSGGNGGAFPPPMAGAAAPSVRDRVVAILPPEDVTVVLAAQK